MKIIHQKILFIAILLTNCVKLNAQQVNTDSLLMEALEQSRQKNYERVIQQALQGISAAPDYLDFHLLLGRTYQFTGETDSARYYLRHVIAENPEYRDAFTYLINLELQEENWAAANRFIDEALAQFPDHAAFYQKKLVLYQQEKDEDGEWKFLLKARDRFPENPVIRQRVNFLESKRKSNRVGIQYSYTGFEREGVGPWHLLGVQYIRERKWGSLIGRVNFAERMAGGENISSGLQYELESYVFMGKNGYSYVGGALSSGDVFPAFRAAYSYFHNHPKGWETEIGGRVTGIDTPELQANLVSGVVGVGKYLGSHWLNLRTFVQHQESGYYPALTLQWRYFVGSRFDYWTLITGYGTSPDERTTLNQIDRRVRLDSYRAGGGYYRFLGKKFLIGLQVMYNRQEYIEDRKQSEMETFMMIQYKF